MQSFPERKGSPLIFTKFDANRISSEKLHFCPWILVYLHEDVRDMGSRPKQIRNQTGPLVLPKQRSSKNLKALPTFPASDLESRGRMGLTRVVRTLPCAEVIEERNRMAGEIHDTLAQAFAGILLHLEAAIRLDRAMNASKCLAQAKELAKSGLEDSRRMLLGLRPKSLEGAHLSDALSQLAERFSCDCGLNCTFSASGRSRKLPEEIEDELYRVAQEALCNARKHSCADSVAIFLNYTSSGVVLVIKDNGQGFVIKQRQAGGHGFGLPTMCERANRLGGKMDINTGQGIGTEIKMRVPLSGLSFSKRPTIHGPMTHKHGDLTRQVTT